jgi:hypothetical protein
MANIVRKKIPSVHPGFKVTALNLQSTVIDNTLMKSSDLESLALPLVCLLSFSILAALPAAIRAVRIDPALRYE